MVIHNFLELEQVKNNNFNKITEWKEDKYEKIHSDLNLLLEKQRINQKDLRLVYYWDHPLYQDWILRMQLLRL